MISKKSFNILYCDPVIINNKLSYGLLQASINEALFGEKADIFQTLSRENKDKWLYNFIKKYWPNENR